MRGCRRTIGITALGLATIMALTACASSKMPDSTFAVEIQASRLGVMTHQGQSLLGEEPPFPPEETDAATRARVSDGLRLAVYDLSRLKMRACPEGRLDPALCKQDYAPRWALRTDKAPPEWPELEARIDDASGAIMPVWSDLCDKEREKPGPDDEICPME